MQEHDPAEYKDFPFLFKNKQYNPQIEKKVLLENKNKNEFQIETTTWIKLNVTKL